MASSKIENETGLNAFAMGSHRPTETAADLLQSAAKRNDEFLATTLETSGEAVISIDAAGTILRVNAGATEMFGYSRDELVGQKIEKLVPERFRSEHARRREAFFRAPRLRKLRSDLKFVGRRKDESEFPADVALRYSESVSGITCDAFVTDRSLRSHERWFRLFLQDAPGAIAMFDREMRYVAASRLWLTLCNLTETPFGQSHYDVIPNLPGHWKEANHRGIAGEKLQSDGDRYIRPDGTVMWLRWHLVPWRNEKGAIGGILIAVEDVTAEKEAEQKLRASEERFELALRGTRDGIWDWNLVTGELYVSDRVYELLGSQQCNLELNYNTAWRSRIHPDDHDRVIALLEAHLDHGSPFDVEYRLRTQVGEYRWVRSRGAAVRDQAGKPVRITGAISDITELVLLRQRLEESLQYTDEQLRAVIAYSPLAIATTDQFGKITSWNRAAERMLGYSAAEVIGRISPAIQAADIPKYHELLGTIWSGETRRIEVKRVHKNGSVIEVAMYYTRFLTRPGGEPAGIVVFAEDITLRKRAQEELRLNSVRAALAVAQDEEARRIARELHDDISQRLAVLSMDMSLDADLKRARDWKARLQSYRDKLSAITESIRQISHQMHASILDDLGLAKALEQLCIEASHQWPGFPVAFRAERVPDDLPKLIASCLYRVAQTALHNVAKHAQAEDASVTLSGSPGAIELVIADSGKGFDPYAEQTGLGLASMRERVRLLKGSIAIVSVPGEGTRVKVKLPLLNSSKA